MSTKKHTRWNTIGKLANAHTTLEKDKSPTTLKFKNKKQVDVGKAFGVLHPTYTADFFFLF